MSNTSTPDKKASANHAEQSTQPNPDQKQDTSKKQGDLNVQSSAMQTDNSRDVTATAARSSDAAMDENKQAPHPESQAKPAAELKSNNTSNNSDVSNGNETQAKSSEQEQTKPTGDNKKAAVGDKEEPAGKGPKPVGPNQQTWANPDVSDEVKKKIENQQSRLDKLHENPNNQDPELQSLNKKQDIESRNEDPDHDKKSENSTQQNFDPRKNKVDAPSH